MILFPRQGPNCWRRRHEARRRTVSSSAVGGSSRPTSHDRDYLDLCGPATITITDHGRGEIAFGALQAGLDIEYSRSSVGFTRQGFDEMDEVSGDGFDQLNDDGSIEIELAYQNGDESRPQSQTGHFFNTT